MAVAVLALTACGKYKIVPVDAPAPANATAALSLPAAANAAFPAPAPTQQMIHFVNSPANAQSPGLQSHFINFAFDYPADWSVTPSTGTPTATSFVALQQTTGGRLVSTIDVGVSPDVSMADVFASAEQELSQAPGYQQAYLRKTTFGGLPGGELGFSTTSTDPQTGQPLTRYGRLIIVPNNVRITGPALQVLMDSADPNVRSPADVGASGELAQIVTSFRLAY
ncbi:MAG TPA: hypothetical protein VGL58_11535 [Caulobacteraceae bacterium]